MEKEQILETCYHCGNKGLLPVDCFDKVVYHDYVDGEPAFLIEDNYYLLRCPVCNEITLLKKATTSYMKLPDNTYEYDTTILFPTIHVSNKIGVPSNIVKAFESAKKVQKIDSAICALSLRRVLELICLDKKAQGKTLVQMVEDLVQKNILPSTFDEACKIVRLMGNEGAHSDALSITKTELTTLTEFIEAIINYLYIIPEKIKRMTALNK